MRTSLLVTIVTLLASTSLALDGVSCPATCQCQTSKDFIQVNCANQSLTKLPDDIPAEVTTLDIAGNQIESLAGVLMNFTELQILNVSYNNISSVGSGDFISNPQLSYLNLQGNQISHMDPESFSNLSNLEVLNLGNNSIAAINSAIFHGLTSLSELTLSGNKISNISDDAFTSLSLLSVLDLSDNDIRNLPYRVFSDLEELSVLNLSYNSLNVINGDNFHTNNSIRYFDLSHNSITDLFNLSLHDAEVLDLSWNNITNLTSEMFTSMDHLTALTLDGNPVQSIFVSPFESLRDLQNLSLSHMPYLTYLSPTTFQGLENLTVLHLHHNPKLSFIHKELFSSLFALSIIDLSYNNIETLLNTTFQELPALSVLDITHNSLICDCGVEWLVEEIQTNTSSILRDKNQITCVQSQQGQETQLMQDIGMESLHCSEVRIVNHTGDSAYRIGRSAILRCVIESSPSAEITWITPRKKILQYHNYHEYSLKDYLPVKDDAAHAAYHATHEWHEQPSYYAESVSRPDRIIVLEDGSLYIDYVMRPDAGPYRCIAKNPKNQTEIVINVTIDMSIMNDVKIWSFVVGFACAGSFFLLNLIYSLTLAAVRRCVSQRRREQIHQVIESMDQYKTAHLARIKENYNNQVGRIRDQYHYQLGRLREHHQNQTNRIRGMREGASHKVDKLRENYNNQLARLKDYSSSQMLQIREKYNNQIDKIKDYGNDKFDRIHEKYKLKQQHVSKILEMMNLDNCRTVFDSECVRTESMILQSDIFATDVPIHSPLDSLSFSDDEYLTATSSDSSKYTSQEHLQSSDKDITGGHPIHPYIPDDDTDDQDSDEFKEPCASGETPISGIPEVMDDTSFSANPLHIKHKLPKHHKRKPARKRHSHNSAQFLYQSDPLLATLSSLDEDLGMSGETSVRPKSSGDSDFLLEEPNVDGALTTGHVLISIPESQSLSSDSDSQILKESIV